MILILHCIALLAGVSHVKFKVQAAITDSTGTTLTSDTVLGFELVQDSGDVGGLEWDCVDRQATVRENSVAGTSVTRLTAHRSAADTPDNSIIKYYIVSGDPQRVFRIDSLTVSRKIILIFIHHN